MVRMLRNAEFKDLTAKMLALLATTAALLFLLCSIQTNALHAKIVDQSSAIVGKVLTAHPELEQDIIGAVVAPASQDDINRGRAALAAYGYTANTPVSVDPIVNSLFGGTFFSTLGFLALCALAAYWLVARGYSRIYKKVRTISDSAEKVVDGNFSSLLPSGEEGEFEVLGHRFNQMANRLKLNMEQLLAEKIFLKNIISDISHQLKTPLSTLVVYSDLLAEDENMDVAQRRNFIELGRQQLQRLEWLIQSLLKMARLEAGSIEFRHDTVLLRDVAESAVSALGIQAAGAGVSVEVLELCAQSNYRGDADWLAEAVINILKNGIEHSHADGAITITLDQSPLIASITIADRGEGIEPGDLPHIFDRFYRSSHSVKPNSIGIGLAMSKAIIEGQGGSIAVKSEKGKGSEFTIVFLRTLGE